MPRLILVGIVAFVLAGCEEGEKAVAVEAGDNAEEGEDEEGPQAGVA